jgi:hypothetical protein
MPPPYLSKSDFKAAYDCDRKLRYKKARYPTNLDDNEYVKFLADGGFMVEHVAKAKFPGGLDLVDERDQAVAYTKTLAALAASPSAVIYEAAALHEGRLARIDILRREGDTLHLIEVKSSSFDSSDNGETAGAGAGGDLLAQFLAKTGLNAGDPTTKWMPYFLDVTFQRMVAMAAFPGYRQVRAWLCLVDKSAVARESDTLGQFKLIAGAANTPDQTRSRPKIHYLGRAEDLAQSRLVTPCDVTALSERLLPRVRERAAALLALLRSEDGIAAPVPSLAEQYRICRKCEYRLKGEAATKAEAAGQHGFAECWGSLAHVPHHILELHRVTQLAENGVRGPVEILLERGQASYLELTENDLGGDGAYQLRRRLQWACSQNDGREHLPDALRQTLAGHQATEKAPLYFLDFEACNVALPHHAGMHPYERVAFQFSCHRLDGTEAEDAPLPSHVHRGWLNTEREFPNFKFVRALRDCLGETGTIYVWSPFEQSTLVRVLRQMDEWTAHDAEEAMRLAGLNSRSEWDALRSWLDRLLGPEERKSPSAKPRRRPPRICDLHELALEHYFHPEMLGRTSIKAVLPAVWRHHPAVHNHPWFRDYLQIGDDGAPRDPYKVLPPLPLGGDEDNEDVVADGTGAIRIYQELIFREDAPPEHTANRRQLLEQYCRLDTAAMLMIWRHWRGARAIA